VEEAAVTDATVVVAGAGEAVSIPRKH